MAAITDTTQKEMAPNLGAKQIMVHTGTAETADDTDTIAVTLANHGMTKVWGVIGYIHTTLNSVIVEEAPTTAVSAGVLTITVGGSTDNKGRCYIIFGE